MSDIRFPASLKPIVSKGYSQTRGSNVFRTSVTGGLPRQGRDVYFEAVPFSITLLTSSLGRQAFLSFLNNIHAGADSFIMPLDSGLGIQDHQVMITSTINDSTDDGLNWTFTFTITAERTAIQEDTCLTANLPDLFGCYGDCLAGFLKTYGVYQTTFPRIWSDEGPAGYPPINMQAQDLDGRIVYSGPSVNYLSSTGLLASSAVNEWPLQFVGGVAVGRVAPEGLSSNLNLQSGNILNAAWTKVNLVSVGSVSAPDASTNALHIASNATSGVHNISQSVLRDDSSDYTYSVFLKAAEQSVCRIQLGLFGQQANPQAALVNLTSGTITAVVDQSRVGIKSVGNGWYRVWSRITTNAAGGSIAAQVYTADQTPPSYPQTHSGDGVSGINVWGSQIEKQSQPSSYIPTTTAISNRASASASVFMNGATSIDITYSDASVVNVPAVSDYAPIPQANAAWGSKFITRIDFNV